MAQSRLSLSLLGGFEVVRDGRPPLTFRLNKARALLAFLVVESGRSHSRATLAALFWPDMPDQRALHNLSQTLLELRRAIGDSAAASPFLLLTPQEVCWQASNDFSLDVARFRQLIKQSATAKAPIPLLEEAAELYQGELLARLTLASCPAFDEWLLLTREQLAQLALKALAQLTAAHMEDGNWSAAERYARQQLVIDPWNEPAQRHLMQALASAGLQSSALQQYERFSQLLFDELGVEPQAATTQLAEVIRAGVWKAGTAEQEARVSGDERHHVPRQLTPLLGRKAEVAQLLGWLAAANDGPRLITVTGVGGVGKTRLALAIGEQAARPKLPDPPVAWDNAWFIPLAPVNLESGSAKGDAPDANPLALVVARTLNLALDRPNDALQRFLNHLHDRRTLLILDNAEHLLPAVRAFVLALLSEADNVWVLVTSRERLNLEGEMWLHLDGLPVPASAADPRAADYSSVRLFMRCAQQVAGGLALDERNLADVAQICRLVGGLPLGIELAAAWIEHFTCAEIATEIAANLEFLESTRPGTPQRQRSLWATFSYSWNLLTPAEQHLLARLSVFRGRFSREAAFAVADSPTQRGSLTALFGLVNKSLLRRVATGHYELHELLRQYAVVKLEEAHERREAEARHGRYYLALLAGTERTLTGPEPRRAVEIIAETLDNMRLAWRWAVTHADLQALDKALFALGIYGDVGGAPLEAALLIEQALDAFPVWTEGQPVAHHRAEPAISVLQGRLLAWLAYFRERQQDSHDAYALAQLALKTAESAGDVLGEALANMALGLSVWRQDPSKVAADVDLSGESFLRRAITLTDQRLPGKSTSKQTHPDERQLQLIALEAINILAFRLTLMGKYEQAREWFEQTWPLIQATGYRYAEGRANMFTAGFLEGEGAFVQAKVHHEAALEHFRAIGSRDRESMAHNNLAGLLIYLGEFTAALDHAQAALSICRELGFSGPAFYHQCSWAAFHNGRYAEAVAYAHEGLASSRALGPYLSAMLYLALGEGYLGLRQWADANQALETALRWAESGRLESIALTIQARYVTVLRQQGAWEMAQTRASSISERLLGVPIDTHLEPLRSYLDCYQALETAAADQARPLLQKAYEILQHQVEQIEDERQRRRFLEDVPTNRQIMAAWRS